MMNHPTRLTPVPDNPTSTSAVYLNSRPIQINDLALQELDIAPGTAVSAHTVSILRVYEAAWLESLLDINRIRLKD